MKAKELIKQVKIEEGLFRIMYKKGNEEYLLDKVFNGSQGAMKIKRKLGDDFDVVTHRSVKDQKMKVRKLKPGPKVESVITSDISEKLPKDADAGDYIKDFRKSDAPQFKGKSDKKIQKMAIAAYLDSKEEVDLEEVINYDRQLKDPKKETMIMSKKDGKPFVIDKKDENKWLRQGYIRVEEVDLESKNPHINAYVKAISDTNRTEVEESLMSTIDLEEGGEGSGPQKGDKRGKYDTKGHTTDKPKGFFDRLAQKYIDKMNQRTKDAEKRKKMGALGALIDDDTELSAFKEILKTEKAMKESKMGALFLDIQTDAQDTDISKQEFVKKWTREAHLTRQEAERMWTEFQEETKVEEQEETKVEEKEINPYVEATSLAIKAAARALGEKPIDPADLDDLATDDDRKAADKNIIIQLRRAQDMVKQTGRQDQTGIEFLDNPRKKMKVDIKIINKALEMFDKMRPNDKARMQSTISKSYRGLLDTVKRGRV